jgi:hypothetical protein
MATGAPKISPANRSEPYVALHKSLILLESGREAAELNGSPQLLSGSSRLGRILVEFVNHPEAVSISPMRGGNA